MYYDLREVISDLDLTNEEKHLLWCYRRLSDDDRYHIFGFTDFLYRKRLESKILPMPVKSENVPKWNK